MNTKAFIAEAISLPVEKRALITETLLKSLNTPEANIDEQWLEVAKHRASELKNGSVNPIPAEAVFEKVWKRFDK